MSTREFQTTQKTSTVTFSNFFQKTTLLSIAVMLSWAPGSSQEQDSPSYRKMWFEAHLWQHTCAAFWKALSWTEQNDCCFLCAMIPARRNASYASSPAKCITTHNKWPAAISECYTIQSLQSSKHRRGLSEGSATDELEIHIACVSHKCRKSLLNPRTSWKLVGAILRAPVHGNRSSSSSSRT